MWCESGGGFEGDFGGEAEGIGETEEKVGRHGLGVTVEDGGAVGAGVEESEFAARIKKGTIVIAGCK
jgi:hypothetical protein